MKVGYSTKRGLITIPIRLQKLYGIRTGTKIFFQEDKDGIKIIPITSELIEDNKVF